MHSWRSTVWYVCVCVWQTLVWFRYTCRRGGWWHTAILPQNDNRPDPTGLESVGWILVPWLLGRWDQALLSKPPVASSGCIGKSMRLMFLDIPRSKRKGVDWQQESEVHWVPWFNVQSNQLQNNSHFGLGSIHRGLVGDYWIYGLNKMIHGLQLHSGHSTHSH